MFSLEYHVDGPIRTVSNAFRLAYYIIFIWCLCFEFERLYDFVYVHADLQRFSEKMYMYMNQAYKSNFVAFLFQVFTPQCMMSLLRIFNFLWRAKRMEYILAIVWKNQMSNSRGLRGIPGMSSVMFSLDVVQV